MAGESEAADTGDVVSGNPMVTCFMNALVHITLDDPPRASCMLMQGYASYRCVEETAIVPDTWGISTLVAGLCLDKAELLQSLRPSNPPSPNPQADQISVPGWTQRPTKLAAEHHDTHSTSKSTADAMFLAGPTPNTIALGLLPSC